MTKQRGISLMGLIVTLNSDVTKQFLVIVSSYDSTTGITSGTTPAGQAAGIGTSGSSWTIGPAPASIQSSKSDLATLRGNTDDAAYLTTKVLADGEGFVALTDASTIAINCRSGNKFWVVLGGARTIGVPTNPYDGMSMTLKVDCNGYTPAWPTGAGGFDYGNTGLPTPVTTAGKWHYFYFEYDATRNKWTSSYWIPA